MAAHTRVATAIIVRPPACLVSASLPYRTHGVSKGGDRQCVASPTLLGQGPAAGDDDDGNRVVAVTREPGQVEDQEDERIG
jgi:hypothetical protein